MSHHGANHGVFTASPLNLAPAKLDISGNVTASDGKPFWPASTLTSAMPVVWLCTTAATDGDGHYETSTLDPATYSVAPAFAPDLYTPTVVRVTLSNSPATANFTQEVCNAPVVHGTRVLSAAGGVKGACGLKVVVNGPKSGNVGLTVDPKQDLPAFLALPTTATEPAQCLSGCQNLAVSVTDSKGRAVPGARITVTVSPLPFASIAQYPGGLKPGSGVVCNVVSYATCGSSITLLTAVGGSASGRASLLYWPPGVIKQHTVKVSVFATAGKRSGRNSVILEVRSHLLVHREFYPTSEERSAIEDWTRPSSLGATIKGFVAGKAPSMQSVLTDLAQAIDQNGVASALGWGSQLSNLASQEGQEQALTALIMSYFNLSGYGIQGDILSSFAHNWAGKGTVLDGLTTGLLTSYSEKLLASPDASSKQYLQLYVYEISYCELDEFCGPGGSSRSHSDVPQGVKSFLYFYFQGGDAPGTVFGPLHRYPLYSGAFAVAYNPGWLKEEKFG